MFSYIEYLCGILAILIFLFCIFYFLMKNKKSQFADSGDKTAYYDFHTHILPGVDDGAADMETAVAMLEREVEDGSANVVLTPHYHSGRNEQFFLLQQFKQLQQEIQKREIPVELYLGSEVLYRESILTDLAEGKICTINHTVYVLIEFYPDADFSYIRQGLNEVMMLGFRPVLAHVERYEALQEKKRIKELIEMGVLIQVNTASFFRPHIKKYVLELAKQDMVHLLGSDCHNLTNRCPNMSRARQLLKKELEPEQYKRLCVSNPKKMIQNIYI